MNKNDYNGKKILIVDDDIASVSYAEAILRKTGAEILSARDGAQAVDIASKEKLDLILMDMQMPVMDGYDATRAIRKFNSTIPIIAYTAHVFLADKEEGMAAGCNAYLEKPVYPQRFLKTLDTYLK